MTRTYKPLLLLAGFIAFFLVLLQGLEKNPHELPSALIDHPLPELVLPDLFQPEHLVPLTSLKGQVSVFHVWATWCGICREEHHDWLEHARNSEVPIVALLYKDDPVAAKALLTEQGNPYQQVLLDSSGFAAIEWGLYGTPETFIIDKQGIIRKRIPGKITPKIWKETVEPLLEELGSPKASI